MNVGGGVVEARYNGPIRGFRTVCQLTAQHAQTRYQALLRLFMFFNGPFKPSAELRGRSWRSHRPTQSLLLCLPEVIEEGRLTHLVCVSPLSCPIKQGHRIEIYLYIASELHFSFPRPTNDDDSIKEFEDIDDVRVAIALSLMTPQRILDLEWDMPDFDPTCHPISRLTAKQIRDLKSTEEYSDTNEALGKFSSTFMNNMDRHHLLPLDALVSGGLMMVMARAHMQ